MTEVDRRSAMGIVGVGLAAAAAGAPAFAQTPTHSPAFAGNHKPVPLGSIPPSSLASPKSSSARTTTTTTSDRCAR